MARTLPKEIASLIHHITLNEQGWWDKTIQRLIISALGSAENKQLSTDQILTFVKSSYGIHIDHNRINKQLDLLCSSKAILKIDKKLYMSFQKAN
jgi:hypothetical protein